MTNSVKRLVKKATKAGCKYPTVAQLKTLAIAVGDVDAYKFLNNASVKDMISVKREVKATMFKQERKVADNEGNLFGMSGDKESGIAEKNQEKIYSVEKTEKVDEDQKDIKKRKKTEEYHPETSDRKTQKEAVSEPLKEKVEPEIKKVLNAGENNPVEKRATYGDKRDYRKIDIYVDGEYKVSTTWASSCKEAKEKYIEAYPDIDPDSVRCTYAKNSSKNPVEKSSSSKKIADSEMLWLAIGLMEGNSVALVPFKDESSLDSFEDDVLNVSDVSVFFVDRYGSSSKEDIKKEYENKYNNVHIFDKKPSVKDLYYTLIKSGSKKIADSEMEQETDYKKEDTEFEKEPEHDRKLLKKILKPVIEKFIDKMENMDEETDLEELLLDFFIDADKAEDKAEKEEKELKEEDSDRELEDKPSADDELEKEGSKNIIAELMQGDTIQVSDPVQGPMNLTVDQIGQDTSGNQSIVGKSETGETIVVPQTAEISKVEKVSKKKWFAKIFS